ncbi:MAG: hypothetical protein GY953_28870, partial [bacterium]|nr:hypothetical protein [bacterium]
PFGPEEKSEEELFQMLAGAAAVLSEAGAGLIGGHSSLGAEAGLGFTVNGLAAPDAILCVKCGYHRGKGVQMATVRDRATPASKSYDGPGGSPYASPGETDYESDPAGFIPSRENEPSWESGGTLGAYFNTMKSVIIDPKHTFTNIVLRGDWQQPISYAVCTYLVDFLGWLFLFFVLASIGAGGENF